MSAFDSEILKLFEDILNNGTDLRVRVTGRSMSPYLRGGEVLTVRKYSCSALHRGDLVLCRNRFGRPVMHRIIRMKKAAGGTFGVITKGDALLYFDEEIDGSNILGKVCSIERTGPSGQVRRTDMHSTSRTMINFMIALLGFFKTRSHSLLSAASKKWRTLKNRISSIRPLQSC